MKNHHLTVNMLGKTELSWNGNTLNEKDSRSRKTWLLLAYLIYCRHRSVPQSEIIDLLWEGGADQANPHGTLKTTLHRLRTMLDRLMPGAGHELILRQENGYRWNPDIPMEFDVDTFHNLACAFSSTDSPEEKLDLGLRAAQIYQGDFLEKLHTEAWTASISAPLHQLYVEIICSTLDILESQGRIHEMLEISRKALVIEPYSEPLCGTHLRALAAAGCKEEAVQFYEELCRGLMDNFRRMPWDSLRKIYRKILQTDNGSIMPFDEILEQLREENDSIGALYCEYDFFKVLYQAQARAIARTGEEIHIGLLSVKSADNKSMSQRSQDLVMRNLKDQICSNMRRGDIATRCSASQFIIMLPRAAYDSSCMVCERIIRAFYRNHPHSPAEITYIVHPVEPAPSHQ